MQSSFQIGSVLGITIRVHVLAIAMGLLFGNAIGFDPALGLWFLLLGLILLLHELGHCLAARRFGIQVIDITIWPLGGMARLATMPESSRIEGLIALAGPAVNFALAAAALPIWLWVVGDDRPSDLARQVVFDFLAINLVMGTFNLIPAFPTDGGRILRAVLGRKGDWVGATEKAVVVGRIVSAILFVVGIRYDEWTLPVLALWLWWMGWLELRAVRQRHARFASDEPGEPSSARASTGQSRPSVPGAAGFTEDDIERLERFRGRLRQFEPPS